MERLECRIVPRTVISPARYRSDPGDATGVYSAICAALSGAGGEVDWTRFSPSDWSLMARISLTERVGPLLHFFSRAEGYVTSFPPDLATSLSRAYYHTAAFNALYFKRIRKIAEVFAQRGLPFILLKGSALASGLYPSSALRPMGDIDFLVSRDVLEDAVTAVAALGFREPEGVRRQASGYHVHLRGGNGDSEVVEIHWTLDVAKHLQARLEKWLWQNVEPCDLPGASRPAGDGVLALSPTAALLVIAAHQAEHHRVRRLLWLYDIHLLISKEWETIDWEEARARAEEFQWSAALRASLVDAAYHFATVLPVAGPLAALTGERIHQLESIELANSRPVAVLRLLRQLSWMGRLWLIRVSLVPGRRYMIKRYRPNPELLWPLFYMVRWWGFAWESLKSAPRILKSLVAKRTDPRA